VIKTSSWFTKLPADHARIGISRGTPKGVTAFRMYHALAPGPWFQSCATPEEFMRRYYDEVLAELDPRTVVATLESIADGDIPTLLCWEPPPPNEDWCHRGLVSAWLHDELGLEVTEYRHESEGFGWQHPKLHPDLRGSTRSNAG